MAKVASFELDHTKVKAPYVRLAGEETQGNEKIEKFDLRFIQPNVDSIPTAGLHTLEHLLAAWLRDEIDQIIDISPMGCRTGFYLILWGEHSPSAIRDALANTLERITKAEWSDVQGTTAASCGNYKDHSLFTAQEYAKQILAEGISSDPFVRKLA
ncbi:MAG: S-ribosylhomocysteine lyase [Enterococcaceae bacterium]|jgi:S-ribosylhomocysteine lyase|nr:S-ribosylhomocysteine lyase [Enterococcaceae bacterium]MCI1919402.1 S-ribosylhomocysteine lyase [Enterococcaceae bacterium]